MHIRLLWKRPGPAPEIIGPCVRHISGVQPPGIKQERIEGAR